MGCFAFECCGCHGRRCNQNGGQSNDCIAIVEVPLSDNTTVYLKGDYEQYGYVDVEFEGKIYEFYPIQFEQYFLDWFEDDSYKERSTKLLAKNVYTYSEPEYIQDDDTHTEISVARRRNCQPTNITITTLTKEIIAKFIRADHDIGLPNQEEWLIEEIKKTKEVLQYNKNIIERKEKELSNLENQLKEYLKND